MFSRLLLATSTPLAPAAPHSPARREDIQSKPRAQLQLRFVRDCIPLAREPNHEAAIALHFMYYSFRRIHLTLRCTPAMEAGVSDHFCGLEEIVNLLD